MRYSSGSSCVMALKVELVSSVMRISLFRAVDKGKLAIDTATVRMNNFDK